MKAELSRIDEIPRSLEASWDYAPDWRGQVVQLYLHQAAELLARNEPDVAAAVLAQERDPYVRGFFSLQHSGAAQNRESFVYAQHANQGRRRPTAATIIKAMTLAGYTVAEIARQLGTKTKYIAVYQRIFFDVSRYLHQKAWLHSLVFGADEGIVGNARTNDGQDLLAVALLQGRPGLELVLNGGGVFSPATRADLHARICSAVTQRAHMHVAGLQAQGSRVTGEDFTRFLKVAEVAHLEAHDGLASREVELRDRLITMLHRKITTAPDPAVREEFLRAYEQRRRLTDPPTVTPA